MNIYHVLGIGTKILSGSMKKMIQFSVSGLPGMGGVQGAEPGPLESPGFIAVFTDKNRHSEAPFITL